MSKINYVLTIILFLTVGFYVGNKWNRVEPKIDESRPLDYSISLDTPKGILIIKTTEGYILINSVEGNYNNRSNFKANIVIGKDKYPKLFRQGQANASLISAKLVTNKSNSQFKVELSNNEPDHGDYSASYRLSIDPITGTIEENLYPRRDDLITVDEKRFLVQYPAISKLIGNVSLWKLNKKQIIIDGKKFESLVTINITDSNPQRLFIFDKNSVILEEKGYGISMGISNKGITVKYRNDIIGIGDDTITTKVYEYSQSENKLAKIDEYEEQELRRQNFKVGALSLEVVFSSAKGCASCHAQTITITEGSNIYLSETLTDPRVSLVDGRITIKSQTNGGGAPSPDTMGVVKVYAVDNRNKILIKTKEYRTGYTIKDYEGK
jgi:hypothetical protein